MNSKSLAEAHTPLALSIGNEFFQKYPKFTQTEFVSEAYVGLMKAEGSFDPSKGVAFGSFAKIVIKNHLLDYISKQGTYIERIKLADDLKNSENNSPTEIEEIDEIDPLRETHRNEIKRLLVTQKRLLSESQKTMVDLLSLGHSYSEIAQKMGVSKQAVHKSLQKSLELMRAGLEKSDVHDVRYALPDRKPDTNSINDLSLTINSGYNKKHKTDSPLFVLIMTLSIIGFILWMIFH